MKRSAWFVFAVARPMAAQRIGAAGRANRAQRQAASWHAAVQSVVPRLSHQASADEPAVRAGALAPIARRAGRRDARGHQQRDAANARLQASLPADPDRRHRRLSQDHPGARAVGGTPWQAYDHFGCRRVRYCAVRRAGSLNAADAILSGSIKSSGGQAMGGVMVSAKPEGGTITTTVLTDEAGPLLLPAPCRRKVPRLGAGAVVCDGEGRDRSRRGEEARFHASADGGFLSAIARQRHAVGAARGQRAGQAHEGHRAQQLHGLPHRQLCAAASLRRSRLERHRRADEERQRLRHVTSAPAGRRPVSSIITRRSLRPISPRLAVPARTA